MKCESGDLTIKNKMSRLIKKKGFRLLSIILIISLIIIEISFQSVRTMAAFPDKPGFTISNISFNPSEPRVGEEIEVSGTITPTDFEISVPSKEIVLVLDVSGSMSEEVTVKCENEREEHWIEEKWEWQYVKVSDGYWTRWGWTDERWEWKYVKVSDGHWQDDYCSEHQKFGEHNYSSTKIAELKKAANNFVDKMKNVPNLKIGIVAYSSKSWINPNGKDGNESTRSIDSSSNHEIPRYQSVGDNLLNITDSRLPNMINSLEALGGTNTGEGMRKAAYMLRNENGASKTIVLMSDGLPTFYSVSGSNNRSYYTTIDSTNPYYAGSGSGDNSGYCLNYAKTIGGLIEYRDYNVFSIGYGLNNTGNEKLRQIHESMGGTLPSNNEDDDEKTYFATDNGAIDAVFQNIATQIINNYVIKDVTFNSQMIGEFELAGGGDTILVPDIQYKKDENNSNLSKIRYHAEPYTFTFKIKASEAGYFSDIFNDSYISFPWNNETISSSMPDCSINIIDNELPNIQATLASVSKNPCKLGDDVTVTYNINPQDFVYEDMSSQLIPKDVAIILDTSSSMKTVIDGNGNGSGGGPLISTLWVDLLKNNILDNKNIKFGIVTADSNSEIESYLTDGKSLHGIVGNIDSSSDSTSDMKLAMEKAEAILNGNGSREGAGKYVVIISMGNLKNVDQGEEVLRNKGYNVISMTFESSENDNLKNFHNKLIENGNRGSIQDSFIIAGDKHNNIKFGMDEIAFKLGSNMTYGTYNFGDVKLNFDLNGNFDVVSGLEGNGDDRSTPAINIEYRNNNGVWHADSTTISFTIKPNKIGHLSFKENTDINGLANYISYIGINKPIKRAIGTPTIDVIPAVTVNHGLYEGIDNQSNAPIIKPSDKTDNGERKIFAKGAIIPMAASFDFYSNTTINLLLDENVSIDGDIKIYKVNSSGNLSTIGTISNNGSTTYPASIGDGLISGDKILILYNAKLPNKEGSYINSITVGGSSPAYATIHTAGGLPELF